MIQIGSEPLCALRRGLRLPQKTPFPYMKQPQGININPTGGSVLIDGASTMGQTAPQGPFQENVVGEMTNPFSACAAVLTQAPRSF